MIDPFFVTANCSLSVRELTEKNATLAYTWLIITSCLDTNLCGSLGMIGFSLVICKTFNHVKVLGNMLGFLLFCFISHILIVIIYSKKNRV